MQLPLFIVDNPRVICLLLLVSFGFLYYQYRILHIDADRAKGAIRALYQRVIQQGQQAMQVPPSRTGAAEEQFDAPQDGSAMTPEMRRQYQCSVGGDVYSCMDEDSLHHRKNAEKTGAGATSDPQPKLQPPPQQHARGQNKQRQPQVDLHVDAGNVAAPGGGYCGGGGGSSIDSFDDDLDGISDRYIKVGNGN
jgi:hypothetical protein